MNIKERINTIKAKRAQIEALLSAKEKEVEEEYQMVMELYNEVSERVETIKAKQKTTEETLDKYDSLLAFLNDGVETKEETTEETVKDENVEETTKEESVVESTVVETKEEVEEKSPTKDSSENIDELLKLIDLPKEEPPKEKKEVKSDSKWKVELEEEQNNLIDQIGAL